jgi:hypothetical protein|tara:strand:- start:1178 stop:1375 length:198 start_codon:yes stop_codon:yes gene_type:complete
MQGIFVIRNNDKILEFNNYDDIPQSFDNVIKFEPTSPEPPHTEEEHEEMETYNDKLKELLKREKR